MMLANTFNLPRCAMPIIASFTPESAATLMMASKPAIVLSPPSNPKRFCPKYFVPKKFSKTTASLIF